MKLAIDSGKLYVRILSLLSLHVLDYQGSNALASKAASLELDGLRLYHNLKIPRLCTPLMVTHRSECSRFGN